MLNRWRVWHVADDTLGGLDWVVFARFYLWHLVEDGFRQVALLDIPDSKVSEDEPPARLRVGFRFFRFRRYCAQCHGLDATGDGPVASALKKKPANLTTLAKNHRRRFS